MGSKKPIIVGCKASSKEDMIKLFKKAGYTEQEIQDYYSRKAYRENERKKDEEFRLEMQQQIDYEAIH